jgi:eukaryotic-like serine/threonine-protein kinase
MERIGEYFIKRLVGEGGMGKVYEAEERLSKRKVALKVLRPELTRTEDGRRLFLNEMQILAHLEHPNIVRSLASMEEAGQLVLVLEFLDGRTLRDELTARGRLPWPEAVEVAVQIARALEVAHSQAPPIVHRDLKPENVMLVGEGTSELKVMDFGIAKVLEAVHATNTQSIGTLQYMSPEQIDAKSIDARSDLYSLGLMLYEMISGGPPFRSASPRELLNMQCTQEPPELDAEVRATLPRGVEELLFSLLEKSPDARPKTATDVATVLAPFRPAEGRSPRTQRMGRAASAAAPRASQDAPVREPPRPSSPGLGTAAERPAPPPKLDTIALVEKATAPKEIPTALALLVIVALSLVAGLATYVVRARTGTTVEPAGTSTTTAARATSAPRPQ